MTHDNSSSYNDWLEDKIDGWVLIDFLWLFWLESGWYCGYSMIVSDVRQRWPRNPAHCEVFDEHGNKRQLGILACAYVIYQVKLWSPGLGSFIIDPWTYWFSLCHDLNGCDMMALVFEMTYMMCCLSTELRQWQGNPRTCMKTLLALLDQGKNSAFALILQTVLAVSAWVMSWSADYDPDGLLYQLTCYLVQRWSSLSYCMWATV